MLAQILSPLTAGYSLRIFNECFEFQLGEAGLGPLTRYRWRYAKWHACIWLSGQTPAVSKTEKWRLKGGGDLGPLPHSKLVGAVDFLASGDNMQHVAFGTHRVKTSTGWVEFPKTQRRQCAEALHTAYAATRDATLRLGRSHFLELAEMVAGETQKSYGALDTYAEQNGRQQAKRLREYCAELGQLASKLEHASLLPEGDAERTA